MHRRHAHGFPYGILIFPITMVSSMIITVWLTGKIVNALETLALTNVLDEMDERLSDVERADLEGRIRERVFGD